MTKNRFRDQTGSVAVISALCMMVLLGLLAFVLNTGLLYAEKNKLQNAVEAAALAGAAGLCGADPTGTAEAVLQENLFSEARGNEPLPEGYTVEVEEGYYDEGGEYDFSGYSAFGYTSFVEAANMPSGVYVNSLLVRLRVDKDTVMPDFIGKEGVPLQATAVAYLKRYGLLSLGEGSGDGLFTERDYANGYPCFENMGTLHANRDIDFSSVIPEPVFDANTFATAVGSIANCPEGTPGVEPVSCSPSLEREMEDLRDRADYVIRLSDFPPTPAGGIDEASGPNNNVLYKAGGMDTAFAFGLHEGDHGGVVYYVSDEAAGPNDTLILTNVDGHTDCATHFILASEVPIGFAPTFGTLYVGGEGEDTVYVVCSQDIGANNFTSLSGVWLEGVVFRTGGGFKIRGGGTHPSGGPKTLRIRVIAEHAIILEGNYWPVQLALDGTFGPPCPPSMVKLGRLSPAP